MALFTSSKQSFFVSFCLAFVVVLGTACRRTADAPTEPPRKTIELHNAGGSARLVMDVYSDHLRWRTPDGDAGKLKTEGANVFEQTSETEDPADSPLSLSRQGDSGLVLRKGEATNWDIKRIDGLLRLGDDKGFPRARITRDAESATLYDAGGQVLVVARSDGGRIVVTNRDEAVAGYVVGTVDVERAALLFLPDLSPRQRAMFLAAPRLP